MLLIARGRGGGGGRGIDRSHALRMQAARSVATTDDRDDAAAVAE
jgi:hypothetical protein